MSAEVRRAGVQPNRIDVGLFVAAALSVLAFAITVPLDLPPDIEGFANSAGFSLTFVFSAVHLLHRAIRGGKTDRGWAWIGVALLLFGASNLWYSLDTEVPGLPTTPALADVLWLAAFPPMLGGVALIVGPSVRDLGRIGIVDSLLVASGAFTVCVALVSGLIGDAPVVAGESALTFNTLDVFGDMLLLSVVIGAAHSTRWHPPKWVWPLFGSAILFVFADVIYVVQIARGDYVEGGWLDVGWPLSALMFSAAAAVRRDDVVGTRMDSQVQTLVSVLMIPAVAIVLVSPIRGPLWLLARIAGIFAVTSAGVRLFLAVRRATVLAEQLRLSLIDPLTELPNRRALIDLGRVLEPGTVLATLDLDGLSDINTIHGEVVGDRVLLEVAARIQSSVSDGDVVGRIGGDEFAVLLHSGSLESAVAFAESLVSLLETEIAIDGQAVRVSACAGLSTEAAPGIAVDDLLVQAQVALHEAKRAGSGIVRSFAGATGERSQARLRMRADIREEFRTGGQAFVPHFQPIVELGNGNILAVEALVRWIHDGVIRQPGEFIGEVKRSGSMASLTTHMITSSLGELRASGIHTSVAVNVPPDLVDEDLAQVVGAALVATGAEPSDLIIEVTEEAIMRDPAHAAQILGGLRQMGVRVLLDDFGTGWSGLSSLRDLVVDGLKMDGSFTRAMQTDATADMIVRSVAQLAERLGMLVIYEGVEDPDQLGQLRILDEGYVQGFAVAHPMPVADLARWIDQRGGGWIEPVAERRAPVIWG